MIIDSSAVVAILCNEPQRQQLIEAAASAPRLLMSAATYVETCAVIDSRRDPVLSRRLDDLLDALGVTVVPLDADHARIAREAYRDFGRGSGHPAKLNLGDVFSYALARSSGDPLLWVGDDFTHTDVTPATLVDLLGTKEGADIEFEPESLGLTARTPDL